MHLIDNPQALAVAPAVPAAGDPGWFTIGNPSINQPATPVDDWWLNMVQGELKGVLDAAGIVMVKGNNAQVAAAIAQMIANALAGYAPDLAGYAQLAAAQSFTKAQRGAVVALVDGATITPDFSLGNNFSLTIAGNRTLANPTNLVAGQSGIIVITQDATGSRTAAFGSYWKFASGSAPSLTTTANAVDVLAYYVESANRITARLHSDVK